MMNPPDPLRRALLLALAASPVAARVSVHAEPLSPGAALAELERHSGGRLGVYLLDTDSGRELGYRPDERFGMCSTFKLPLAAAVLREADAGRLALDERIAFSSDDMVPYAPVTEQHLADGAMTVAALAEATQTTSDNVAANLLMRRLGGPEAVTRMFRAMGDTLTRIDRWEPEMNLVPAGEERDTTTPRAIAGLVARVFTGDLLTPASRELLRGWMTATATGTRRIRAGLPSDWIAGDKTGTGIAPAMANKYNDVAVIWPAGRAPVVVAAFFEASGYFEKMRAEDEAVLAEVGRIAARWIADSSASA
jgi:beta-lactamase class A